MGKKIKQGRPAKGKSSRLTLRIYESEYPGLKEFINTNSQSFNETQNDYILRILDKYKNSIEFNQDPQKLSDGFILFVKNIREKIASYEEILEKKDFLKKSSLKELIYNIYPVEIERQWFYLNLFHTQFNAEFILFGIVTYFFQFLYEKENISFNEKENLDIYYDNLLFNFSLNWFNELKFNQIISNREDLETVNFNFDMLERFILKMYKGYQKQLSVKEGQEKTLLKKQKKKKTLVETLKILLKNLFREIVKDFNALSNDIELNLEKNEYKLFYKIKYKPSELFFKLIEIDEYAGFIEKNNLSKSLIDFINNNILFYSQLTSIPSFPSTRLILDMKLFFSGFNDFKDFLKNLPEQIQNNEYDSMQIEEIGIHLKRILFNYQKNLLFTKEWIKEIPLENLSSFTDLPENFFETYNFIRDYLKKRDFDIESEFNKLENKVEQKFLNIRDIRYNLLDPEAKERINIIYNSLLKINKKKSKKK